MAHAGVVHCLDVVAAGLKWEESIEQRLDFLESKRFEGKTGSDVGSGGGAVSVRVRCTIRCFRFGAQSGSHTSVSTPCPPNRTCGFPACPSRGPGRRVHGTARASRVATLSIFHACRRKYPGGNRPVRSSLSSQPVSGLPLMTGGSASASCVSRPARRSLAFRPAWSLSRPSAALLSKELQPMSLPP